MEAAVNENKKKKRRIFTKLMLWLNVGAIACLFLSYLPAHFSPDKLGYITLLGLAYPFILLANIAFMVFWYFKVKRFMLLSALAILIGITHLTDFFQFSLGKSKVEPNEDRLEILTYNVHLFGLYDKENKAKRNKIFDILNEEEADFMCFQEFFHSDQLGYFTTRDSIVEFTSNKYYHERYTHAMNGRNYFGVAMFSKYPIINKGFIPFESDVNNFCIYADIKVKEDTIRVYNAHLQSIRFKPEDYAFVDDNRNQEELETGVRRIARRLKAAFLKRQAQVDKVAASIADCRFPVVLCGDFNDTPVSYTYESFSDLLEDSFIECGAGVGNTYNGIFPSFRIDYVMHSTAIEALDYRTLSVDLSDHFPVVVGFRLKPEEQQH